MTQTKDASILALLTHIDLKMRGWAIRDYWDADMCAIGIISLSAPHRLVYVSTFGKRTGQYDYECEEILPGADDEADYDIKDEGQNVQLAELIMAMERHLGTEKKRCQEPFIDGDRRD